MMMQRRLHRMVTVFVAAVMCVTLRGGAQDAICCRLQTDTCCNRSTQILPCYACPFGWPSSDCCWLDIGQYPTQTVKCGFSTGWSSESFWYRITIDGCLWGEQTCSIDCGCVWDLQWHYSNCTDYHHYPGIYDCPST